MEERLFLVTYTMKPGCMEAFLREMEESGVLAKIRAEDGAMQYAYYRAQLHDDELLLVERWQSAEQQARHLSQPHMALVRTLKERYVTDTQVVRAIPE